MTDRIAKQADGICHCEAPKPFATTPFDRRRLETPTTEAPARPRTHRSPQRWVGTLKEQVKLLSEKSLSCWTSFSNKTDRKIKPFGKHSLLPPLEHERAIGGHFERPGQTHVPAGLSGGKSAAHGQVTSGMAAQQSIPVAIAVAETAAAERASRAVIELIVAAAMVGAIGPAGKVLERAMVAKARRQLGGLLPIGTNERSARGRTIEIIGDAA
jgi:hypothetical protein